MKLIAFYLPQYHRIPENDKWWGEGFTEWTNVKKAKPLFLGHNQPRVPLHHQYYNLLDDTVMEKQMRLAKKYGISGFCFYHYWFNGRKLLEQPVEHLLLNRNAKLPFCMAWANEPWTKTWHGPGGEMEVLIRQQYGGQPEWEEHFNYLLRFFRDERYIKIDNKPMFLIYRSGSITRCKAMLQYWDQLAQRNGFAGLYPVDMQTYRETKANRNAFAATVDFEPSKWRRNETVQSTILIEWKEAFMKYFYKTSLLNRFLCFRPNYDTVNREMLAAKHGKNEFRGVFVDYDDTARRGKRATIFRGSTPKKFEKYLKQTIQKSLEEGNDYIFINAWNEWGEGNYLEPDIKHGYAYLHAVKNSTK